jgi:hypothetical protein
VLTCDRQSCDSHAPASSSSVTTWMTSPSSSTSS